MTDFWVGIALAFPFYFVIDHYLIPWAVDTTNARRRLARIRRTRGRS